MQQAESDRRQRDVSRTRAEEAARSEERDARLQGVDDSIRAAAVSESELRSKCTALEVGRLSETGQCGSARMPHEFVAADVDVDWRSLVRSI